MNIILLKVIILIISCLIGFGVGGLVGNYKKANIHTSIKVENVEKVPSVKEECSEGICPVPKD